MFTDGLNGLNWQVQVLPLSLSMSSLPPTLPVLPVPPLVGVEAEPQAAASTPAATITVIGLRRRIDRPPGFLFGRHVLSIRVPPKSRCHRTRVKSDPRPVIYRKATLTSARRPTGPTESIVDRDPRISVIRRLVVAHLTEGRLIGRIPNHDCA